MNSYYDFQMKALAKAEDKLKAALKALEEARVLILRNEISEEWKVQTQELEIFIPFDEIGDNPENDF